MGIDVIGIQEQDAVSRYELSRLLNSVECVDCIYADNWMINQYDWIFWSEFIQLPWKDFDEISYLWGIFKQERYYYCVAYVGDNNYMRWYPEAISPVCASMFCGARNVTNAEFIQVTINLLSQYIYDEFSVNRDNVWDRLQDIEIWSSEDWYLDEHDRELILLEAAECNNKECKLKNPGSFKTYLKYCMFNLEACAMSPMWEIWQAVWPVAELNIINRRNISNLNQIDIHQSVPGDIVLQALYQIYQEIDCEFDNDYDCDSLDNANDNCPNFYNSQQIDTDGDWVWDVCDADIDNDWVTNPIHILDDNWRINISVAEQGMDNCLTVTNPDQSIWQNLYVGDACADFSDKLALHIDVDQIIGSAPLSVNLKAVSKGEVKNIVRDLDDGTQSQWEKISHTFYAPWIYTISSKAEWIQNDAFAKVTIIVWENPADYHGLTIDAQKIGIRNKWEIVLASKKAGTIDKIVRDFWDDTGPLTKESNVLIKKIFDEWHYVITAKWFKDSKLVSASMINIWIGPMAKWSELKSSSLNPAVWQKINFNTEIYNISRKDISYIDWDFWGIRKKRKKSFDAEYSFQYPWPKVIKQTIQFKDESQLTNIITLFVQDPTRMTSHSLEMIPDKLWIKRWQDFMMSLSPLWDKFDDPLLLKYHYTNWINFMEKSLNNWPISSEPFLYQDAGVYYPKSTLHIDQCRVLENQATIVVHWFDICLEAFVAGTLDQFACDMDDDGIPDICDIDIDGDGIKNLIWIISSESSDCSISPENINFDILWDHLLWSCVLDNCPFEINPNQEDLNIDGIGDVCFLDINDLLAHQEWEEALHLGELDNDGDGIQDNQDLCPDLPENYNWIEDYDWCPEIWIEHNCSPYGIFTWLPETPNLCDFDWTCEDWENCDCLDCEDMIICCEEDCGSANDCNNNWSCENGENCDCPDCENMMICSPCGNGIIDPWETCLTCPEDVWPCPPTTCEDIICPGPCFSCPCQYVDFASDLAPGDIVRANLYDFTRTIFYDLSSAVPVDDWLEF